MRKALALLVVLALMFCVAPQAFARDSFKKELLAETTLDDSPTSVTGDGIKIDQYDKVGVWVTYDETEVDTALSATLTIEFSYDDTTYITGYFFDFAGGPSTFQTSETLSSDGTYFAWIDNANNFPYMRIKVAGVNVDSDNTVVVSSTLSAQK